jgi:hypothetical protein
VSGAAGDCAQAAAGASSHENGIVMNRMVERFIAVILFG